MEIGDQRVEIQNVTTVFPEKTAVDPDQGRDLVLSLFQRKENTKTKLKRTKLKKPQKTRTNKLNKMYYSIKL